MIMDSFYCFGHYLFDHDILHNSVKTLTIASHLYVSNSSGVLSMPGDLPYFSFCIASSISDFKIGNSSTFSVI